jgi:Tol biopolymer transport system component
MPAKKKSDDEELKIEISQSDEEAPVKKPKTKKKSSIKIPVTNWEEVHGVNPIDDAIIPEPEEESISNPLEDEMEVKEIALKPGKKITVISEDEDLESDDGHEWHKIEETTEEPTEDEAWAQTEDEAETSQDDEPQEDISGAETEEESDDEEIESVDDADEESEPHSEQDEEGETEIEDESEPSEELTDAQDKQLISEEDEEPEEAVTDDELIVEELKAEDAEAAAMAPKPKLLKRIKQKLNDWLHTPKIRNRFLIALAGLLIIAFVIPTSRYTLFNLVGVRASAQVRVLDSETQLPLKAVSVKLSGMTVETDMEGVARFSNVRLGTQTLTIVKSAYAQVDEQITIKTGANSLDNVDLQAIGTSFEFKLVDWLGDQPLEGGEVVYGENSAFSNNDGMVKLNIPPTDELKITVLASAGGYTPIEFELDTTSKEVRTIKLVVSRQTYFVSKRSGTYDVYRANADGSAMEVILEGTGHERSNLSFDVAPSGKKAILAASRDKNIRNEDGFLLTGLYVIDTTNKEFAKIDSSEAIDIVGWIGDSVIYVKIKAGASGQNPERHRLMSYNTATGTQTEIAASNYFNDVLVADSYIFYAPSDAYKKDPKAYLYRSNVDGTQKVTIFAQNVWTVLRTGLDDIKFDSKQVWYKGSVNGTAIVKLEDKPTEYVSRLYTDSPSGEKTAWVDLRDGKGSLIIVDKATGEEKVVTSQSGLRNPIVWLSEDHIVYRVVTTNETSNYVIELSTGAFKKITDVTNVSGADRWYYYY